MTKNHFRKLEQGFSVPLPADEDGFVSRDCPNGSCSGRFMIKFGTGLTGNNLPCICPYCGNSAPQDQYFTEEQIAYIQSVFINEVGKAFRGFAKDWDKQLRRQTRGGIIQMRVDYKGHAKPLRYYQEKGLETQVVCTNCTLEYKIYGEFAYCPDCGTHNSLQILQKNLELIRKQLNLATEQDKDFAEHLTRDALENCVSTFDGFGREIARINASKSNDPDSAANLSFQNLDGAQKSIVRLFNIDLTAGISASEWAEVRKAFQKRHVIGHRMGVIDAEYIRKTNDPSAIEGRKILISSEEVLALTTQLDQLAHYLKTKLDMLP